MDAPLLVNLGTRVGDGTGDGARAAFGKINANALAVRDAVEDVQAAAAAAVAAATTGLAQTNADLAALGLDLLNLVAGPTPAGYPPRRGQFLAALEASGPGRTAQVLAMVPTDPGDPVNRAWFHTTFVTPGCSLALLVRTTLGLTGPELTALIAAARPLSE